MTTPAPIKRTPARLESGDLTLEPGALRRAVEILSACPCGGEGPVCHEIRLEIGDLMLYPSEPCRCRNCGHTQACHERTFRERLFSNDLDTE